MPKNLMAQRGSRSTPYQRGKSCRDRLRSVTHLSNELIEKSDSLNSSTEELSNARTRLLHCLGEIDRIENNLRDRVEKFERNTKEMEGLAKQIIQNHTIKDPEQKALLDVHTSLSLEDADRAKKQIEDLKYELEVLSPIVPEFRKDRFGVFHCYDQVVIPKLLPTKPLELDIIDQKPAGMCGICCENRVTRIILDCGHMFLCASCANRLLEMSSHCPICRTGISKIIEPKLI